MSKANGSTDVVDSPVSTDGGVYPTDRLEAEMTLKHSELLAAARIRANMTGHLSKAMENSLNQSVAQAAASYAEAYTAFERAS